MRRHLMLGLWSLLALGLPLASSRVLAQAAHESAPPVARESTEPPGYRETVEQALSEYAAKNYEEAGALFTKAHALYPNARTLRGLGMAAFELRRYEESIPFLEGALGTQTRALDGQLRSDTEALLVRAQSFVARVSVSLSPVQAALALDGKPVTQALGAPLLLGLGEHALSAEADGYLPQRRDLRVHGGEVLRLDLTLQKRALAAAAPGHKDGKQAPRRLIKSPWLWTAVGAVVIGAVVAGVLVATRDDPQQRAVPTGEDNPSAVLQAMLEGR